MDNKFVMFSFTICRWHDVERSALYNATMEYLARTDFNNKEGRRYFLW